MGSGKTSTGKALAAKLGWPFADLDDLIAEDAGKSIPEIFEEGGEEAFRALELNALRRYLRSSASSRVLALGGGTLMQSEARQLVRESCKCVYLKAGAPALYENLTWEGEALKRPLLSQGKDLRGRIEELLAMREAVYESAADLSVNVEHLAPEQVADDILKRLENLKQ